ncbi:MAG: lytic transglycosylase domain-containing protein [Alphaproteobacteria bacterium]|nr:lytic transglycosylase domain-containing protein [Alphaproteobacteria bacterium]
MRKFLFSLIVCSWTCFAQASYILSSADISTYNKILHEQSQGNHTKAKQLQQKLHDASLLGYILFQRYFSKNYPTKKQEISSWMQKYSDLPIATDMYALGVQKKVKNLKQPTSLFGKKTNACTHPMRTEPIDLISNLTFPYLSGPSKKNALKTMKHIVQHLKNGHTLSAKKLLYQKNTIRLFSQVDIDKTRTALAFNYFLDGENKLALENAEKALIKSKSDVPLALWVKGLILWREHKFSEAAQAFSELASLTSHAAIKARSSFWAARAYLRSEQFDLVIPALRLAAEQPRNFYGFLAMRALGLNINHAWASPSRPEDEMTTEFSHPALNRFYALKQLGQTEWAEQELSKLYLESDDDAKKILTLISEENGFSDALQGLTGTLEGENTRYPMPNWCPMNDWQLDKALVFAFVRQESCFNHRAESKVGALGLMQIMPDTGKALAETLSCPFTKQRLKEPAYNLALGQTYLKQLLESQNIQNNLLLASVAYNAGPGNLMKWEKKMSYDNDPLLFLESIPSKETRSFTERVLMNYWVYRGLTNQSLASLDQIVHGQWPLYQ